MNVKMYTQSYKSNKPWLYHFDKKWCKWLLLLLLVPFFSTSLELVPLDAQPYVGDFKELEKKRNIRVLVAEDLGFYYVEHGKPKGMIAEMLYHFEASIRKKYPTIHVQIIPVSRDDLIPSLTAGFGDVVVANLTHTIHREEVVDFSTPVIKDIKEFLVTNKDVPNLSKIDQLSGKEIWVRESSSYFESIESINQYLVRSNLDPIDVNFFDEALQDYEIIEMVNQGYIYSTILDSHKTELWLNVMEQIKIHSDLPLRSNAQISWAFRKNSPLLEKEVNTFIHASKSGTLLGNVLYERYIDNSYWLKRVLSPSRIDAIDTLHAVFEKYSEQYNFDWLMILAQAFQESGLDNNQVSHKGAVGIMQLLPSTANDPNVNIKNIEVLENNVHAGVKYMRFLQDRYFSDENITPDNKTYLSLAAYNAGPGNIAKMRRLAVEDGYDPNVWFKNVEVITLRNIGREPVNYVANINRYFVIYKQLDSINQLREEQSTALLERITAEEEK